MSNFNHYDHNIDIKRPTDAVPPVWFTDEEPGPFTVVLYNQDGDAMPFAAFDLKDDAYRLANQIREEMEGIAELEARDVFVGQPDMAIHTMSDDSESIYLYIPTEDGRIESDPLLHLDDAVPMLNWLVDWHDEWIRIYLGPSREEMSSVVEDLVNILAEVGPHLTCSEADRVAEIARTYLSDAVADNVLYCHAQGDSVEEEDAAHHLALQS